MCADSFRETSSVVTGDGEAPFCDVRNSPPVALATTMSPVRFHDPPTAVPGNSHSTGAGPPETRIFLSVPPASKATHLLSGDQKNGGPELAVSEPRSGRTASESIARIHNRIAPSAPMPMNA